jgi:jumonji domain-containing protein 7
VAISLSLCVYDWLSRHADAIAAGPGGRLFFVEPFIEQVNIAQLLETLNIGKHTFMLKNHPRVILSKFQAEQESDNTFASYLQSQNGNIYSSRSFESPSDDSSEFDTLREDVPSNIPWVTEALGMKLIEQKYTTHNTKDR